MSKQKVDISNKYYSYIISIAELGTISAAAEKLFITQPALSRFVKNLEQRVGLALFDRIDNRLVLTQAGRVYVEYAKRGADIEQTLANEIVRMQNEKSKTIRIGIPDHWAAYIIPILVTSIETHLPQIHLEIVDVNSGTLEQRLLDATVDLTLSRFPSSNPSITSSFLHDDQIYLAVPDSLADTLGTDGVDHSGTPYIDFAELSSLTYILPYPGQSIRKCTDRLLGELGVTPKTKMLCRSVEACMRMASSGMGCCFVSDTHRRHVDIRNSPRYFALNHPAATLPLRINYLSGRKLAKHVEQFISLISAII